MTFTDLAKSYVRTVVPVVVGLVSALALRAGVDLHGYAPEVTAAVTAGYYALARIAEHYVSPKFGWLLGYAVPPDYSGGKVRKLKSSGTNTLTVELRADTSQFMAALREVQAEVTRTQTALAAVKPPKRKRRDAGLSDLALILIIAFGLLVVVLLRV